MFHLEETSKGKQHRNIDLIFFNSKEVSIFILCNFSLYKCTDDKCSLKSLNSSYSLLQYVVITYSLSSSAVIILHSSCWIIFNIIFQAITRKGYSDCDLRV